MTESVTNQPTQRKLAVRVFAYCINKLWLLLATLIIVAALAHIALGLLLPKIDRYNQEITDWVKQNYDLTIDITELSAEWDIQGPSLTLKDFQIKSADGAYNLLEVKNVSVEVDLFASLLDQRVSTEDITIDGADIQFYISSELGVALSNDSNPQALESIGLESISHQLFDALFGQRRITIINSNLSLFTLAGTEFKYLIDELDVIKYDDIHQLFGRLSYTGGGDVTLVSEVYGDPTSSDSYSNVYLEGSQIDIASLPWVNLSPEYKPKHGNLSWKFWGSWRDKHWHNAKAIIELNDATLGQQTVQDNLLKTMISWEHQNIENGYMAIHDTQFTSGDIDQVSADSLVRFSRRKEAKTEWDFYITELESEPISNYLKSLFEDENPITQFFNNTSAKAKIENMHVSLTKDKLAWQPLTFELDYSDLSINAYESIPDLKKISGSVSYSNSAGTLTLNSEDTELMLPDLFRHSIQATSLSAITRWNLDEGQQLKFDIDSFKLRNKDFSLVASGAVQQIDGLTTLNLYTELHEAAVANKSLYLPVGVMTDNLVSYLDSSIKTGTLSIAKSIVRGPVSKFPFDSVDGIFVAHGEVKNASYQYLPDWPIANSLDASLMFEGSMMDIIASSGESLGNRVSFARAYSSDLSKDNSLLELSLDASSQDNSGKEFIKQTPLDFLYDAIKDIDYQGKLKTQVDLKINLDNTEQIEIGGKVEFPRTSSLVQTSVVNAKDVFGILEFTDAGIVASKLKANYFGKTLDLTLQSGRKKDEPKLSIDIKGALPVDGITHFIGKQWGVFFKGESDFTSLIQFSPSDAPESTRVLLQTDFKGMQLDFPGEFGKSAEQASETYLTLELGDLSKGEIKWGNITGNWYWKEQLISQKIAESQPVDVPAFIKSESNDSDSVSELEEDVSTNQNNTVEKKINVGNLEYGGDFFVDVKKDSDSSIKPGLRVSGKLKSESLEQWLEFISKLEQQPTEEENEEFELIFESIELLLEKLDAGVTSVESVNVALNKKPSQPWEVGVKNSQIDGLLVLNEYSPWTLDVKSANLQIAGKESSENNSTSAIISPLELNDIDFRCSDCSFNQVKYGEILAEVRRVPRGVSVIGQMNNAEENRISVSGLWLEVDDSQQETQILVELNSRNIGQFLKQWDLDATVEDSSGRIIADTWWSGAPWQMDYKQLDGDFQLALGKGYLSEISDEQGRLFSLFNLQSILRKLTFDFKDVYKKGFFYDSINGTIRMEDGVVSTENVEIEGNVADVKLYGKTDLRNETIDQTAVITPHLTSSFPVLAAWAVEPTTGLLVFLLDKIMEPAVEVATRLDYRISGTFDEVVVEEMTRAKKKIKVEYASEKPLDEEPSGEATDNQPNESLQPVPKLPVSDQKIESEPESQEKVVPETSKPETNDEEVDVKSKEKEPDPDPLEV
ncbi:MAG: AsmA-like C-terminal region-containing protein [Kangiellaceae bacterium]